MHWAAKPCSELGEFGQFARLSLGLVILTFMYTGYNVCSQNKTWTQLGREKRINGVLVPPSKVTDCPSD